MLLVRIVKAQKALGVAALIALAGCGPASEKESANPTSVASAALANAAGNAVGLASLIKEGSTLSLKLTLSGMPAGEKALHFHTTGACDAPDFMSAGGHLNPTDASHGRLSETGPHLGDLPNIEIAQDGLADITIAIHGNAAAGTGHILDEDGTAIMIHAGPDDYKTDPAGAAGPRIACGVFEAS
jgi:Cu-Zn family superoxide dismutase